MRIPIIAMTVIMLLSACSAASPPEPDRLVLVDDGEVVTIDRDGANAATVATTAEGRFFQPIWSPDRSLLAFSYGPEDPEIYVARLADDTVVSTATDTFPFYFSWSVRNDLAILHNDPSGGLRLDTTSLDGDSLSDLQQVESGQPLYFSWSPAGDRFAAHVGTDRLVTSDLSESTPLDLVPGVFPAPSWTERGIMAMAGGQQRQVLSILAEDSAVSIASVSGPATFLPNHDASLVAIQSVSQLDQFQSAMFQELPRIPANRLMVVDIENGDFTTVVEEPVFAYFWSPVDDQLLLLDVVPGPKARWRVWTEDGIEELVRFTPDPTFFNEFVPFFDQYAQSVSLWAPDGSAIAFPGTIDDETGIWVQPIDGEPALIHDGTWVSWAP